MPSLNNYWKTLPLILILIAANYIPLVGLNLTGNPDTTGTRMDISLMELPNIQVWIDSINLPIAPNILDSKNFQAAPVDFNAPTTNHAYWFKIPINNNTNKAQHYWLNTSVFDSLSLVDVNNNYSIQHRGVLVKYTKAEKELFQSFKEHKYGFSIKMLPNSKQTYFLRIKNTVRFESSFENISLTNANKQPFKYITWNLIFNSIFFGILIFLALFSLIQFFQNKDLAYFFYALYLTICTMYMWWKFEKSNSFLNILFSEFPTWYYHVETPTCLAIYMSYLYFLIHFINAKKEIPVFYKLFKSTTVIIFVYLLLDRLLIQVLDFSTIWQFYFIFRILLAGVGLLGFYFVFKAKTHLSLYLLSGSLIVLIGSCITAYFSKTMTQHYWHSWDIPLLPIQIAILIEAFLFSIGLGYKTRLAERDRTTILQHLSIERKEKEAQKKQKEQLTHWFTNISHELRTPLTVILGMTKRLKGNFQERAIIQQNSQQLLSLVNQTLDLNKIRAAKMEINWVHTDVIQYLKYICEPFNILAQNKQQYFTIQAHQEPLLMPIDKEKLQQIISNLLSNAIKFTPKKGHISLKVNQIEQAGTSYLQIYIQDTGKAIPKSFHTEIFKPYTQLPNTKQGTGIGLALVKDLTELLGGTVTLRSQIKNGNCFSIMLPIQQLPVTKIIKKEELNRCSPNIKKCQTPINLATNQSDLPLILIVEDSEDISNYLKQLFLKQFIVVSAADGQEGLKKALTIKPDLIISDVMMPNMDGFELCKNIREKKIICRIPIILITARDTEEDKLKAFHHKADAFLTKPFNEEELLLRINHLLEKQQQGNKQSDLIELLPTQAPLEKEVIQFMILLHETIEDNLKKENFKVKDLCAVLNMNHVSLNKKIKSITGKPTGTYIRHYRLSTAKKLLETTDLSTAEIAWKVGIPEASNFSNMYKKAYGVSPRAWRKGEI